MELLLNNLKRSIFESDSLSQKPDTGHKEI